MGAVKVHVLRAKPPWREGLDHSMCGRRAERCTAIISPGEELVAAAKAWNWGRWRHPRQPTPNGLCAICCERLAVYGYEKWLLDPVAILRIDVLVEDRRGRDALRVELLALAALAAEYPGRFGELLESENVLQVLAGMGGRR